MRLAVTLFPVRCLILLLLGLSISMSAQEMSPKCARYHKALLKRPDSDTLFGRFFSTWLETDSIGDLETFLASPKRDTSGDALILARFYLRQGQDGKATEALFRVTKDDKATQSQKATAYISLSEVLARELEFESALEQIDLAIEVVEDPEQLVQLGKRKGKILLRFEKRDEALEIWKELISKDPADRFLREDVVSLLSDEGLYDEAVKQQKSLIDLVDKENDVYAAVLAKIELGQIYRRSNNWREALNVWKAALPATGQNTWVEREILGLVETAYRRSDDLKGLKGVLKELSEAEPSRLSLLIAQAKLLSDLREDGVALEKWRQILQLTPGDQTLRLDFVRTLRDLERPVDAAVQLNELIAMRPDDAELHFELAEIYHEANDPISSGKSLLTFLEQSDGSEFAHLRVARKLARFELIADADKVFNKLITQFPDSSGASDAYAMFLYDNNRKGEAIARWRKLAATGDLKLVVRVSRQLALRFEASENYSLLKSRLSDFESDSTFLTEIGQAALVEKHFDEAFSFARKNVELASTAAELKTSIDRALQVSARLDDGFNSAVSLVADSQTINSQCLHALLKDAQGETEAAIEHLKDLAGDGTDTSALFPLLTLTKLYYRQAAWTPAAETLKMIVSKTPGGRKSENIKDLIGLYVRASKPEQALTWAREWKKLAPRNPQPWMRESEMLEKAGSIADALRVMQDAGRRFERDTGIQIRLGNMYAEAGYPLEAERIIWKLYEDEEDEWNRQSWITELAKLAEKSGRMKQLIAELEVRRRNNSKSLAPILALAEVYRLANRDREYKETLIAASSLEPDNIFLSHRIVDLDISAGRFDEALSLLESIRAKDKSGRTINRIARLYVITGQLEAALSLLSELPNGKKPSVDEIKSMALTAMSVGEWQAAANFLEARLDDHPDVTEIHFFHAIAQLEAGNRAKAKNALLSLFKMEIPATPSAQQSADFATRWSRYLQMANTYRAMQVPMDGHQGPIYNLTPSNYHYQNKQPLPIPQETMQLHAVALFHLLRLEDIGDPEFREEVIAAGLSEVNYDLTEWVRNPDKMTVHDLFARHGSDSEIAQWYLSHIVRFKESKSDSNQIVTALDTVAKNSDKETAASLALQLGEKELGFGYLEKVDAISARLLWQLIQVEGDEYRNVIDAKLREWVPNNVRGGDYQALSNLLNYYQKSGQKQAWLERVNREWQRGISQKDVALISQYITNNFYGRRSDELPGFLPGVNPVVYYSMFRNGQPVLIPDGVEPLLATEIGPKSLRYLLGVKSGNPDLLKSSWQALKENPETLSDWFLLGHVYGRSKNEQLDIEKSLQCFLEARLLPMQPGETTLIDWEIFQLANREGSNEFLKKSGIEAALRLRSDPYLVDYMWQPVGERLTTWGVSGKNLRPGRVSAKSAQIAMQGRGHSRHQRNRSPLSRATYVSLPNPNTMRNRVAQLVEAGNKETVVRILSSQLPLQAGRVLSVNGENSKNEFGVLKEQLAKAGLIDLIIDGCRPGNGARSLDKARFAAVCEILGRNDLAVAEYRHLLIANPDDGIVRLRLIHSLADENLDLAIDEMRSLADSGESLLDNGLIAVALSSMANLAGNDLDRDLQKAEAFLSLFETIEVPTKKNKAKHAAIMAHPDPFGGFSYGHNTGNFFSGPQNLLRRLANSYRYGSVRIPQMTVSPGRGGGNFGFAADPFAERSAAAAQVPQSHQKHVDRRLVVFKKLALRLIELDYGNEEPYFSQLVGVSASREELRQAAELFVERVVGTSPSQQWWSSETISHPVPWLIEDAYLNKNRDTINAFIGKLGVQEKMAAEGLVNLYFCQADQFNEKIKDAFGVRPEVKTNQVSPQLNWALVSRIRALRPEVNEFFDPTPSVLALLDKGLSSTSSSACVRTAIEILKLKGGDAFDQFLDDVGSRVIGKKDGDYLTHMLTWQTSQRNTPEYLFFLGLMNALISERYCAFKAIDFICDRKLGQLDQLGHNPSAFTERYDGETGENRFFEFVENSPLFGGLDDYQILSNEGFVNPGHNELNSFVAIRLNANKSSFRRRDDVELRKRLAIKIAPDGEASFGRRLIAATFAEKPDNALLDFFSDEIVNIQNLPDQQQNQICLLARDLINFGNYQGRLSSDQRAALQWIGERSGSVDSRKLDSFSKAKSFREMGGVISQGNLGLDYSRIIQRYLVYDWRKSFAAFENVCVLGEQAVIEGRLAPDSLPFADRALERSLNLRLPVECFAFHLAAANSERLPPVFYVRNFMDSLESDLDSRGINKENRIRLLSEYFADIQGQVDLKSLDNRIALPMFHHLFRSLGSQATSDLQDWLKQEKTQFIYPVLAKHAAAAVFLEVDERDTPMPPEIQAYFLTGLQQQNSRDVGVRLMIAELLCDHAANLPDDLMVACFATLADGWQSDGLVRGDQSQEITYRFRHWSGKDSPDLEEIKRKVCEAFHRKFVAEENLSPTKLPKYRLSNNSPSDDILKLVVELQLQLGENAQANQLLQKFEKSLLSDAGDVFAILVRSGAFEMAATYLRTKWKEVLEDNSSWYRFDPQMGNSLKGFIEWAANEEPWVSRVGELVLVSVRDPYSKDPMAEGWGKRNERLRAVAGKFKRDDFSNSEMREMVLNLLIKDPSSRSEINSTMVDMAEGWSVRQLAREKSSSARDLKIGIYANFLRGQVVKGDFKLYQEELRAAESLDPGAIKKAIKKGLYGLIDLVVEEKPGVEVLKQLLPLQYQAIGHEEYRVSADTARNLLVMHFATGTEGQLKARINSLDHDALKRLSKVYAASPRATFEEAYQLLQPRSVQLRFFDKALKHKRPGWELRVKANAGMARFMFQRLYRHSEVGPTLNYHYLFPNLVLNSETVEDMGARKTDFRKEVNLMVVNATDLKTRRKIFEKGIDLIRKEQRSANGWIYKYWNGYTPASRALIEYGKSTEDMDWSCLALIADILWNETPADFVYGHSHEYSEQDRFSNLLRSELGFYQPKVMLKKQIELLSDALGPQSEWGSTAVLLPQFYESLEGVGNPVHIIDFINAADEIFLETANPLANEFAIAGRIVLAAYHHEYGGIEKVDDPDKWQTRAYEVLTDREISISARMGIARFFTNRLRGKLPKRILQAAGATIAEGLNSEQFVSGYTVSNVLRSFNWMATDEQWQQTAREIIEGWWHKCRFDSEETKHGRCFRPVIDPVLAMLELMLILGDEDALKRLMLEKNELIKSSPRAFALLVQYGKFAEAEIVFNGNFTDWDVKEYEGRYDVRFDRELADRIPEFLKTLNGNPNAIWAEMFLLMCPDLLPEDDHWQQIDASIREQIGIEELPNLSERLALFAERHKDLSLENFPFEYQSQVFRYWQVSGHFLDLLSEASNISTADIDKLFTEAKSTSEIGQIFSSQISVGVAQLKDSQPEFLSRLIKTIGDKGSSKHRTNRIFFFRLCLWALNELVAFEAVDMDASQLAGVDRCYSEIFERFGNQSYHSELGDAVGCHLIVGALLDGGESLRNWKARQAKVGKDLSSNIYQHRMSFPHVISRTLGLETHKESRASDEVRLQVIKAYLSDPWIQKSYEQSQSSPMLMHLIQHHCVTPADMEAHDQELAKIWPYRGVVASELVEHYAREGKWEKSKQFARLARTQLAEQGAHLTRLNELQTKVAIWFEDSGDKEYRAEMLDFDTENFIGTRWLDLYRELKSAVD